MSMHDHALLNIWAREEAVRLLIFVFDKCHQCSEINLSNSSCERSPFSSILTFMVFFLFFHQRYGEKLKIRGFCVSLPSDLVK